VAWWAWLLIWWAVLAGVYGLVISAVLARHSAAHEGRREATPFPLTDSPELNSRRVRQAPSSGPPAGRPPPAAPRRRPVSAAVRRVVSSSARVSLRRMQRRTREAALRDRRRASLSWPGLGRVPGAGRRVCCPPQRPAGHVAIVGGVRRRSTVSAHALPAASAGRLRAAGTSVRAPSATTTAFALTPRRVRTPLVPSAAERRGRIPQRLLALTALSAIALTPVLARSNSALGLHHAIAAELAANPSRMQATLDDLTRGAELAGRTTPILDPDWPMPSAPTAPTDPRSRTVERVSDPKSDAGTSASPRTVPATAPSSSGPAGGSSGETSTVLPPVNGSPTTGETGSESGGATPTPRSSDPTRPRPLGPTDAEPTDPTGPAEPADPQPTHPAEPTDPAEPAGPTGPAEPADPAEPVGPVGPADPADLAEPQPTHPAEPTDAEPTRPTDAPEPTDLQPADPLAPAAPTPSGALTPGGGTGVPETAAPPAAPVVP
jgi:hypothetical protein